MFDKYIDILTAIVLTRIAIIALTGCAVLMVALCGKLTSDNQSNHPAKIEVCK